MNKEDLIKLKKEYNSLDFVKSLHSVDMTSCAIKSGSLKGAHDKVIDLKQKFPKSYQRSKSIIQASGLTRDEFLKISVK